MGDSFNLRTPREIGDEVRNYCMANNISITGFFVEACVEKLIKDVGSDDERQKIFDLALKELHRTNIRYHRRKLNSDMYFFWQTIERIRDICIKNSIYDLPMPIGSIKKNVSLALEFFNSFDEETKKDYVSIAGFIGSLTDQENLNLAFNNKRSLLWRNQNENRRR